MRDYSFGNFLHGLRKRRGLSQYQLGMLVGVSNKAVSKWENGSARPQSRILYELSDVLGVTVDELLACKYHSIENGTEKGVFAMKNELWKKADQNLLKYYGKVPPIELSNRYLSEYAELQDSDIIVYFDLLSQLRALADNNKEHIHIKGVTGASLTAFIMGASEINPLKPHYYCPYCRKIEFAAQALCGWDLPARQCSCGKELLRDGHHLPFETLRFPLHKNIHFDLSVSHSLYPTAKEWIHTYFADCTIITLVRRDHPNLETIVIIQDDIADLNSEELPFEEYYGRFKQYPTITWMIDDTFDVLRLLEKETGTDLEKADFTCPEVLKAFIRNDTKGIPEFNSDFVRDMIDEISPKSFHDLIQISGLSHGTGVWPDNARQLIRKGIRVGKTLAYRDDVFNCVQEKLEAKNLSNTGYAYMIMENTRRGIYAREGISSVVKQQLADIGMDEWFSESIEKIQYAFPKAHGVLHVKYALILMWYKINFPKAFQRIICNQKSREGKP